VEAEVVVDDDELMRDAAALLAAEAK